MTPILPLEVFEKELAMCQRLSQKNKGRCQWGECAHCGVLPLLYKLGKGELIEDEESLKQLKEALLNVS